MIALLDGDIFVHRIASACAAEDISFAKMQLDDFIKNTLRDAGTIDYEMYLNGSDSFRKQLTATYKANRTAEKPAHLEPLREHCVLKWNAKLSTDGLETDDELGLAATKYWQEDVAFALVSIDKDLLQIPGHYYNFVRKEWIYSTPMDGARHFWKQMLIGDASDNVKGVTGIGPVKAARAIDPCGTEADMCSTVKSLYTSEEHFLTNLQLLWILKNKRDPQESLSHYHSLQKLVEEAE